jgi:hypothetical protein
MLFEILFRTRASKSPNHLRVMEGYASKSKDLVDYVFEFAVGRYPFFFE